MSDLVEFDGPIGLIRVYPVDDVFVVADSGGWVPGAYDTPEAARDAAVNMATIGTPDRSRPVTDSA